MNGPLACTWAVYDLFKGKRADHLSGEGDEEPTAEPVPVVPEPEGETVRFRRPRIQKPKDDAGDE